MAAHCRWQSGGCDSLSSLSLDSLAAEGGLGGGSLLVGADVQSRPLGVPRSRPSPTWASLNIRRSKSRCCQRQAEGGVLRICPSSVLFQLHLRFTRFIQFCVPPMHERPAEQPIARSFVPSTGLIVSKPTRSCALLIGGVGAGVVALPALLELPSAAAGGLFPFDGDARPTAPAFSSFSAASSNGADEVCHLSRLPLSTMAGVPRVHLEQRVVLVRAGNALSCDHKAPSPAAFGSPEPKWLANASMIMMMKHIRGTPCSCSALVLLEQILA